jgi:hypothetical protein
VSPATGQFRAGHRREKATLEAQLKAEQANKAQTPVLEYEGAAATLRATVTVDFDSDYGITTLRSLITHLGTDTTHGTLMSSKEHEQRGQLSQQQWRSSLHHSPHSGH